jgi:formate hydrogenlyase subunit 6/NADH:ubiquinone oxidoreductase subunit I
MTETAAAKRQTIRPIATAEVWGQHVDTIRRTVTEAEAANGIPRSATYITSVTTGQFCCFACAEDAGVCLADSFTIYEVSADGKKRKRGWNIAPRPSR